MRGDEHTRAKKYFRKRINNKRLLYTKNTDYSQEEEFRITFYSQKDFEYVGIGSLRAIIIGDNFPKDQTIRKGILKIGNQLGVSVYQVQYSGMIASIHFL